MEVSELELYQIGLVINSDQGMLKEARSIYQEAKRLPQGSDVSDANRRWWSKWRNLECRAYRQAFPEYSEQRGVPLLGNCKNGSKLIPNLFEFVYLETP